MNKAEDRIQNSEDRSQRSEVRDQKIELLRSLPSVDEILKTTVVKKWLADHPKRYVLKSLREAIDEKRKEILKEKINESLPNITNLILSIAHKKLSSYISFSLRPVINATGIVIHTNLGRAPLSKKILQNVINISTSYSNLEYNIDSGTRGSRYSHIVNILKDLTGAESAAIVNNNAAAVLLCLSALAKDREVIVSRGELVEIGGSFRIPDIMQQSGAVLKEVGTTNKTHLYDYERAFNENSAMLLKVHQSNYKMIGFTEDVGIEDIVRLSKKQHIPFMYDLGSGCFIDMKPYGIHSEPMVQEIVRKGVDIITFSGDKLLGGPQGGIIIGKKRYLDLIMKNPLMRAIRVDKFTLSAFEATLFVYADADKAKNNIPTLKMLFQDLNIIKKRAQKIISKLKSSNINIEISLAKDISHAGGGSLPETEFPSYVVSLKPEKISINEVEERLRTSQTPVISRIKDNGLILDARTIMDDQIDPLVNTVLNALQ